MKKIAVIGVQGSWSSEELANALANFTGFRLLIDFNQIVLDLSTNTVLYQGVDLTSLDGLVIKKLGAIYSPNLIDRLNILYFLETRGIPIIPSTQAIRILLDRLTCTINLCLGGIPIPTTIITENPILAFQALQKIGRGVLKPLYTSKARGMYIIESGPQAYQKIIRFQKKGHQTIYLQRFITLPGYDLGVVFLNGHYIGSYARTAQLETPNNVNKYFSYSPSTKIINLAYKAQKIFKLDFTCVDIAESDNGPVIFEVSAFGGFHGLKKSANINGAKLYAEHILKKIAN